MTPQQCPSCGTEVNPNHAFCPYCGAKLRTTELETAPRLSSDVSLLLSETPTVQPAKRPLGVWLLTIYHGSSAGILPIFLYAVGRQITPDLSLSSPVLWLNTLLCVAIVGAAIWTWRGNSTARYIFLVLITIYYALIALNNLQWVTTSGIPESQSALPWLRAGRSTFWIIIDIWYFTSPRVKDFFHAK